MKAGKIFLGLIFILVLAVAVFGWFKYRNVVNLKPIVFPSLDEVKIVKDVNIKVEEWVVGLSNPRVMVWDSQKHLLVSEPKEGQVIQVPEKKVVLKGMRKPHGLAFYQDQLFVAEENQVTVWDYDSNTVTATNGRKLFDLPTGGNHTSRSLLIFDDKLYVSVGSTCNVCYEENPMRATIYSANLDGTDLKLFAKGLRNSVFMTVRPNTKEIWATEMGRDFLGNDTPPDEINIIKEGGNYGWPTCYGKNIHDDAFDGNTYIRNPCEVPLEIPSLIDLPAHSAPLGLAFIPESWPDSYRGKLLVAFHGSWNRNPPTGYKVVMIDPRTGEISDFVTGFLEPDNTAKTRPVDLTFDDQGNLYISDDKGGKIFRVIAK